MELLKEMQYYAKKTADYKILVERFRIRLHLLNNNAANKTEYQLNEDEITKLRTNNEMHVCNNHAMQSKTKFLATLNEVRKLINSDVKRINDVK